MSTEFEVHYLTGCVMVRPPGPRLDAAQGLGLKNTVIDLINSGHNRVILSLEHLDLIDSSGLGSLISLHKTLAPPLGRLVLCDLPARVLPAFKLTRLDRLLVIATDVAAATTLAGAG